MTIFAEIPAGYDERTKLWLTPDNRVGLVHPDLPPLIYDETAKIWIPLQPLHPTED